MSKKNKKNKEKYVYVDDGRAISDMSMLGGAPSMRKRAQGDNGFIAKFRTYFESVKLMIFPMLIMLGLIGAAFLILYLLLSLA